MLLTAHEVAERPDRSKRRVQMKDVAMSSNIYDGDIPVGWRVSWTRTRAFVEILKPAPEQQTFRTRDDAVSYKRNLQRAYGADVIASLSPVHRSKNERERLFSAARPDVIDEHRWPLQARPAVKPGGRSE